MRILHAFAAIVLFMELPIPIYWLLIHPFKSFWRGRVRAAMFISGLAAWATGGVLLWVFRSLLLAASPPSRFALVAGLALIGVEIYVLVRVERELGTRRLAGYAELAGTGEMFDGGLYAHMRHPRYTGMFCAVVGAALFAGTLRLWVILAVWCVLVLAVIRLEERELTARFGATYELYRKRVPAFLPFPRCDVRK
jgi:protein-S-isoprenylcysteine O-methyltransferase Ste14